MTTTPAQRAAPSIPSPVYVNETNTDKSMAPVVYVNQTEQVTVTTTNKTSTQMMMGV